MAITLSNLLIKVRADTGQLQSDLSRVERSTKNLEKSFRSLDQRVSRVERSTGGVVTVMKEQEKTTTRVAKKTAEVAAAHGAWHVAQKGVHKATGKTIAQAGVLSGAMETVRRGIRKTGIAFRGAASSAAGFAARLAPVAGALAPFAIGGAAVAGLVAINRKLIEVGRAAQEIGPVTSAFDSLAQHIDTTGEALRQDLRAAVRGTVPDLELMQTSVIALNSEAITNAETLTTLAEAARTLGRTVGLDTTKAFDNLVRGIGLMNPQLLKSVGVLVSVDEATRKWAAANNRTVGSLTDAEKHTAFLAEVMDELEKATGRVSSGSGDLQTSLQRSEAAQKNFRREMKAAVAQSENLEDVAQDFSLIRQAASELALEIGGPLVSAFTDKAAGAMELITDPLVKLGERFTDVREEVERTGSEIAGFSSQVQTLAIAMPEGFGEGFDVELPVLEKLKQTREFIRNMETATGGAFDGIQADISATQGALEEMIRHGWDPTSEAVQRLVGHLEDLRFLQSVTSPGVAGPAGPSPGLASAPGRATSRLPGGIDFNPFGVSADPSQFKGVSADLEKIDQATRAVAAMADASGELSDEARSAVRGLSDVIGGLQGLQGDTGILGTISGALGIGAGLANVFSGMFGGIDENTKAIRENTARLKEMADTFGGRLDLERMRLDALDITDPAERAQALADVFETNVADLFAPDSFFGQLFQGLNVENAGSIIDQLITAITEGAMFGGQFLSGEHLRDALAHQLAVKGLTPEEIFDALSAIERLGDETKNTADAMAEMGKILNAPQGFKATLRRFQATDPMDAPPDMPSSPPPSPTDDISPGPNMTSGTTFSGNTFILQGIQDPEELWRELQDIMLREGGLTGASVPRR